MFAVRVPPERERRADLLVANVPPNPRQRQRYRVEHALAHRRLFGTVARWIVSTPAPPALSVGVRRDSDRALAGRRAAAIIGRVNRDKYAVGLAQRPVVAGDYLVMFGHASGDGRLVHAQIQRTR